MKTRDSARMREMADLVRERLATDWRRCGRWPCEGGCSMSPRGQIGAIASSPDELDVRVTGKS